MLRRERLEHWLQTTGEYSERALAEEVKKTGSKLLQQVLDWSDKVNESINQIPKEKTRVFTGAKDIISRICKETDIYIISSANREAVCREWEEASVLNYVTECMTQEKGTKCECLKKVCALGYESSHVLMVGDALGDKESADVAGIPFFPILAGKEEESWQEGRKSAFPAWLNGNYTKEMQQKYERQFYQNLERDERK